MKQFDIKLNFDVNSGPGSLFESVEFIKKNKFKKILIVLDQNLSKKKYIKKYFDILKKNKKIIFNIYNYYYLSEPSYELLEKKISVFKKKKFQLIIGIGGGSTIDFAKGIALLIKNNKKPLSYRGFPENLNTPVPLIAIPSTAGTGTEIVFNAVFINKKDNLKLGINYNKNYPLKSYLDPLIIQGSKKEIILGPALGAIIRSLDSLTSPYSSFVSKYFSILSYKLIMSALRKYDKSYLFNKETILDLQWGALFSMMALSNSSSGPSGSVSYFLSVNHNVPQGLGYSLAGVEFIKTNYLKNKKIYSDIIIDLYRKKNREFEKDIKIINKYSLFCLKKLKQSKSFDLDKFKNNLVNFFKNNPKAVLNLNKNNPIKLSLRELKQIFLNIENKLS